MIMVLTIVALDSAGKVDISNLGSADLQMGYPTEFAASFPSIVDECVHIWSATDGDDGNGNGNGNDNSDGVGDGDHSTRSN
jgi:hypothetical protein